MWELMAFSALVAVFVLISADTLILAEDMRADSPTSTENVESLTRAAQDGTLPERYGELEIVVDAFSHFVERMSAADRHTVTISFTNLGVPDRIRLMLFADGSARDSGCPGGPVSVHADTGERVVVQRCFTLPTGMRADATALVAGGSSGMFLGNPRGAYHVTLFDLGSTAPVAGLPCRAAGPGVSCG